MIRKILIKPSSIFGIYEVVLFEQQNFLFFKWWKEVSVNKYKEEQAFAKFSELINKYNIGSGDIYDWSADGFNLDVKDAKPSLSSKTHFLSYN